MVIWIRWKKDTASICFRWLNTYADDPCTVYKARESAHSTLQETELNTKIHKAISVLQFKLEGALV